MCKPDRMGPCLVTGWRSKRQHEACVLTNHYHHTQSPGMLRAERVQECRGRGIGTRLVRELVQRAAGQPILLTTLKSTIPFYTPHGFRQVPLKSAPRQASLLTCAAANQLPHPDSAEGGAGACGISAVVTACLPSRPPGCPAASLHALAACREVQTALSS